MTIGQAIKNHREMEGLSMCQLAEAAGITRSYLHEIEHSTKVRPSAVILYEVARVLGVTIETLLSKPLLSEKAWLNEAAQYEMRRLVDENRRLKHTLQRINNISAGAEGETES